MTPMAKMAMTIFIKVILGSEFFTRVEASVHRWAEKELLEVEESKRGATKRHAVMAEMQELGIKAAEWAVRLAIEIAAGRMKDFDTKVSL